MTLLEQLEVDFYVEEVQAVTRLRRTSDRALATGAGEDCNEVAAAAEALYRLVEDWRPLGERQRWHASGYNGPDGLLRCRAMAYVRLWRRATGLAPGPGADRALEEMVAVGVAIGAIAPDRKRTERG